MGNIQNGLIAFLMFNIRTAERFLLEEEPFQDKNMYVCTKWHRMSFDPANYSHLKFISGF